MAVKIDTTPDPRADERVDVFELDGVMYTMPAVVSGATALNMLHEIRERGLEAAAAWAFQEVLGVKAYNALRSCKTLRPADLKAVLAIVEGHVMGALEELDEGKG